MVESKEGLVRSSGAAEVAQCFEVWVCFEGEEYLVYEAASYGTNKAQSTATMALMGRGYVYVRRRTYLMTVSDQAEREGGGQYVSYLVGSEF